MRLAPRDTGLKMSQHDLKMTPNGAIAFLVASRVSLRVECNGARGMTSSGSVRSQQYTDDFI